MEWMYCIDCGTMHGNNFFPRIAVADETLDCCDFLLGTASCPPPEFDMDEFIETVQEPDWEEINEADTYQLLYDMGAL